MPGRSLLVAAACLVCFPVGAAGQEGPGIEGTSLFSGVSYPSLAGGFRVVQALRWEAPEAGIQLTYVREGIAGAYDIYVYPAEGDLEKEVAVSVQAISMKANRVGQQIAVDSTGSVTVAGLRGDRWVLRVSDHGGVELGSIATIR